MAKQRGLTMNSLQEIKNAITTCNRCRLHAYRTNPVPGDGLFDADIMFVGEAPGLEEDKQGLPFVGRAGQLLDKFLTRAAVRRNMVFITNIIKCRPPGNRDPDSGELMACAPFLRDQIKSIRPHVIVTLGRFSGCYLSLQFTTMGELAKCSDLAYNVDGVRIPIVALYHPAYLLRQGNGKSPKARKIFNNFLRGIERSKELAQWNPWHGIENDPAP